MLMNQRVAAGSAHYACAEDRFLRAAAGPAVHGHAGYRECIKVVDRTEDDGERAGTTVNREKEHFSQRLTLLCADGRVEFDHRRLSMISCFIPKNSEALL